MRWTRCILALALVGLITLPLGASIKAMNLYELMEITTDTVHGTIIAKDTVTLDHPFAGSVYTRLTLEGTSLRTGAPVKTQAVFFGSHDPADNFNSSEMPELRDVRVGTEGVYFYEVNADLNGRNLIHNLAETYRVEHGFGAPVVIGKGNGMAFVDNAKLSQVKLQVRDTHVAILADRAKKAAEAAAVEGK